MNNNKKMMYLGIIIMKFYNPRNKEKTQKLSEIRKRSPIKENIVLLRQY